MFLVESYRNKKNRPMSFFVNWIGMTLGLTAVIVIYLYVMQEVRHDSGVFTSSMESVYRCQTSDKEMGAIVPSAMSGFLATMPEVQTSTLASHFEMVVGTEGLAVEKLIKLDVMAIDTTGLDIFPFKMVGGAQNIFANPQNVIVSRSTARRLFDTEDVVGRSLKINNQVSVQIAAVMEDVPKNSTFSPDVIISMQVLYQMWHSDYKWTSTKWGYWNHESYAKLKDGVNLSDFKKKFNAGVVDGISKNWGQPWSGSTIVTEFDDVYLSGKNGYSHAKTVDPEQIWVMAFIALLVLVIAIINYVNIYTARSTEVIKAMGIKTIMGAGRMQLIAFVILDSIAITFLSAISAFILAKGLESFYVDIIGSTVSFILSWDMALMLFIGIPVICGIISGIFPAVALTRLRPLDAIANRGGGGGAIRWMRNGLIVFQFTISIALVGSTIFLNKQINYIYTMDLGYNRENIVVVSGSNFMQPKFDAFRARLASNPQIKGVTLQKNNPIRVDEFMTMSWGSTVQESQTVNVSWGDENTFDVLGIKILEGEFLTDEHVKSAETAWGDRKYFVNETFANILRQSIPDFAIPYKQFVGIFKDFQHSSLTETVSPLAIGQIWYNIGAADSYIKIGGENLDQTLDFIAAAFKEVYPDQLYEFDFLDAQFAAIYQDANMFRSRLLTFSILAVFIGCLGLLALVGYSVQRRRKEIAIRKVYGSTVGQVLVLLSVSFLKWLVIAFVIAVPIIYYVSTNWVEKYIYKTELSWWIFAVAGGVAFVVAIVTVLGQTYSAATENPARNVKAN